MARANAAYYARPTRSPTSPRRRRSARFSASCWAPGRPWPGQGSGAPDPVLLVEAGPGRGTLMADALRAIAPGGARLRRGAAAAPDRDFAAAARAPARAVPDATWHDGLADLPRRTAAADGQRVPRRPADPPVRPPRRRLGRALRGRRGLRRTPTPPTPDARRAEGAVVGTLRTGAGLASWLGARLRHQGGAALFLDYGPARSAPGESLQAIRERPPGRSACRTGACRPDRPCRFRGVRRRCSAAGGAVHGPVPQGLFLARARPVPAHRPAGARPAAGARAGADRGGAAARRAGAMGRLFQALAITAGRAGAGGFAP